MKNRETPVRRVDLTIHPWHNEWLSVKPLHQGLVHVSSRVLGKRILDIGCGNEPYKRLFEMDAVYIGIDVSRVNSSADVVAIGAFLPFKSESFDSVLCTQVMEHVEQPGLLLREARRVLEPRGQLVLSVPMYWRLHEEPYDFFRFTRHGLNYLLKSAGFEVDDLFQQGGAWRVVGQSFANALQASISLRTFGLKALTLCLINTIFATLDRINYQSQDTCNLIVLAHKV